MLTPVVIIAFILLDERVKEGYFFKPSDVTDKPTHEVLTIATAVIGVVLWVVSILRKKDGGGLDDD